MSLHISHVCASHPQLPHLGWVAESLELGPLPPSNPEIRREVGFANPARALGNCSQLHRSGQGSCPHQLEKKVPSKLTARLLSQVLGYEILAVKFTFFESFVLP